MLGPFRQPYCSRRLSRLTGGHPHGERYLCPVHEPRRASTDNGNFTSAPGLLREEAKEAAKPFFLPFSSLLSCLRVRTGFTVYVQHPARLRLGCRFGLSRASRVRAS